MDEQERERLRDHWLEAYGEPIDPPDLTSKARASKVMLGRRVQADQPWAHKALAHIWADAVKAAGLPPISLHGARSTASPRTRSVAACPSVTSSGSSVTRTSSRRGAMHGS